MPVGGSINGTHAKKNSNKDKDREKVIIVSHHYKNTVDIEIMQKKKPYVLSSAVMSLAIG